MVSLSWNVCVQRKSKGSMTRRCARMPTLLQGWKLEKHLFHTFSQKLLSQFSKVLGQFCNISLKRECWFGFTFKHSRVCLNQNHNWVPPYPTCQLYFISLLQFEVVNIVVRKREKQRWMNWQHMNSGFLIVLARLSYLLLQFVNFWSWLFPAMYFVNLFEMLAAFIKGEH